MQNKDISVLVTKCAKVWLFMCVCSYVYALVRVKDAKFDTVATLAMMQPCSYVRSYSQLAINYAKVYECLKMTLTDTLLHCLYHVHENENEVQFHYMQNSRCLATIIYDNRPIHNSRTVLCNGNIICYWLVQFCW